MLDGRIKMISVIYIKSPGKFIATSKKFHSWGIFDNRRKFVDKAVQGRLFIDWWFRRAWTELHEKQKHDRSKIMGSF